MYLIIVYDVISQKRGTKLLKFLRQNLHWVQNSVLEGEVTESGYERIMAGIKEIINKDKDSIIYYTFDSMNYTKRGVIGVEKNQLDTFI